MYNCPQAPHEHSEMLLLPREGVRDWRMDAGRSRVRTPSRGGFLEKRGRGRVVSWLYELWMMACMHVSQIEEEAEA